MEYTMLDIINITQMEILGVKKQYLYYSLLILISFMLGVIVYLMIVKLLMKRYAFVMLYIICSLVMILLTLNNVTLSIMDVVHLQTVLQLIGIAGYFLTCYLLIRFIGRLIQSNM